MRAAFLEEINRILPRKQLCGMVKPLDPPVEGGRPSVLLERMLRIYFLPQRLTLSNFAVEEAI